MVPGRIAVAALVLAAHAVLFLMAPDFRAREVRTIPSDTSPLIVELLERVSVRGSAPEPIAPPVLRAVPIVMPPPREISLEPESSPEHPPLPRERVVVPFSAPRPDPVANLDPSEYAQRAGLAPGRSITAVLALDISETGVVTSVLVEKSSGDAQVDANAVEYARALRWLPGIVNGEARAMRVRFPATLKRVI